MKRRSRAGGEPIKGRRRKTPEPKRRNTPKAAAPTTSSTPGRETEVARLTREMSEALEQQRAASEVLRVISTSAGQLDPVFQVILANATRICGANFGILNLHENGSWPAAAMHNVPQAFIELRRREPMLHFGPEHPPHNGDRRLAGLDKPLLGSGRLSWRRTAPPYQNGNRS
jgi:hypothetical protein